MPKVPGRVASQVGDDAGQAGVAEGAVGDGSVVLGDGGPRGREGWRLAASKSSVHGVPAASIPIEEVCLGRGWMHLAMVVAR
jgi:hypothetical protein